MAVIRVILNGDEIERRELGDCVVIGRGGECDVRLEGSDVSRTHCRIQRDQGSYLLIDLNSRNGTFVDGVRAGKKPLGDGDVLQVGDYLLQFESGASTRRKLDEKVRQLLKEARKQPLTHSTERLWEKLAAARSTEAQPTQVEGTAPRTWYRRKIPVPVAVAAAILVALALYILTAGIPLPTISTPPPPKSLPHSNPHNRD